MKNGICPKCGSETVHSKPDGLKYAVAKGVVWVHTGMMTVASPAVSYVCVSCGYFENYIVDPGKLSEVAKNWQKGAAPALNGIPRPVFDILPAFAPTQPNFQL